MNKQEIFPKCSPPPTPHPPLKSAGDKYYVTENLSYIHQSLCTHIKASANDDLNNDGQLWQIYVQAYHNCFTYKIQDYFQYTCS